VLHIPEMKTPRKLDPARGERINRVRTEVLNLKSQEALAKLLAKEGRNVTRGAVGNWEQGKEVGIESLTAICRLSGVDLEWLAFGKGEMAAAPSTEETANKRVKSNASFPPMYQRFDGDSSLPLLGQTVAGPNGRFILNGTEVGRVFTPPMLEGVEGAYAVRVYGTSMEPRYFAGETVWLNPHEPVRQNDDVVVQLLTDEENVTESYIKRFSSKSSRVTRLWQYNPEEGETNELEFDSERVFTIHKIVFHAAA
jgi:phage repressor protein C with HTH and peptisase S24 domain